MKTTTRHNDIAGTQVTGQTAFGHTVTGTLRKIDGEDAVIAVHVPETKWARATTDTYRVRLSTLGNVDPSAPAANDARANREAAEAGARREARRAQPRTEPLPQSSTCPRCHTYCYGDCRS